MHVPTRNIPRRGVCRYLSVQLYDGSGLWMTTQTDVCLPSDKGNPVWNRFFSLLAPPGRIKCFGLKYKSEPKIFSSQGSVVNDRVTRWQLCHLYKNAKLRGPSDGIFCWTHSFQKLYWKPLFLWYLLLLCQNTHSTNATCCAFNSWLQICKWFGELVFITLDMTSLDDLWSHQEK